MSEAWARTHRRYALVHVVLDEVRRTGPQAMLRWREEIAAEFGTMGEFLCDVQRRWFTAFDARLDELLEQGAVQSGSVTVLHAELARDLPGHRTLLDGYADHPMLAAGAAHAATSQLKATREVHNIG